MMVNKKNNEIELLRFFAALMIVLYHAHKQAFGDPSFDTFSFSFFCHGYIAVEFFFVLSGILLGKHLYKYRCMEDTGKEQLGKDTVDYVVNKAKSFAPEAIISTIISIATFIVIKQYTLEESFFYIADSFWNLLLLKDLGFASESPNGVLWYLTALLVATPVIYYMGRKSYDRSVRFIMPFAALLILGYLDYTTGMLSGVHQWVIIAYKCLWRGLAEMMIGCTLYEYIVNYQNARNDSLIRRTAITVLQLVLVFLVTIYSCLNITREYEFHCLLAIIVILFIVFSKKSLISNLFNNKICSYLGSISLCMFVNQMFCIRLAEAYIGFENLAAYYLFVVVSDILSAIVLNKCTALLRHK